MNQPTNSSIDTEYIELCEAEPNAARRLSICLRGHDVPSTLVEPIQDLLDQLAQVIDSQQNGGE